MIIDNLDDSFIVDPGMDELESLDEAFRQLGFERLESDHFFKDVKHRIKTRAVHEARAIFMRLMILSPRF